nr:hypothetical protein [Tanacetum cinerariifolium]
MWHLKLPNLLSLLRGFRKAQSLELNLDTRINLLQNKPLWSSKEATKSGFYKAPSGSKSGHSMKRKESSSAMDSNPSQHLVSTPVDPGIHKEDQQATGNDASAVSTAKADPGNSAPSDFVPHQQGINEGTKNTSYDHLFAGTDPHVLADLTQSVSEGLHTILTQPLTRKGASSIARQDEEEEASSTIKLEDLAKLVSNVQPSFKELDSPEDDHVIIIEKSDEKENDEIHTTKNVETEDTSVPKSSSLKSSLIQELTNQVLILQSQKHKMELEKNEVEAEAALLKAQPSFPNVEQLKERCLTSQVAVLKTIQWELSQEFLSLLAQVATVLAKLKTLDALPGDESIPSAGQANTMPAKGEKNTNQATISQLFQRRAEKAGTLVGILNGYTHGGYALPVTHHSPTDGYKFSPTTHPRVKNNRITCPFTYGYPWVMGFFSPVSILRKKAMSSEDAKEESTESGEHVHLTKEQISAQKEIKEEAKAEAARREGWEIIYKQIWKKMDYIHSTEAKLGINLDIPLSKQDPLDKLNVLANKKRKHADDIHDYFKANKKLMSSVQYEDHLPGTVLNGPVLGMILFNSYHKQDFVTTEDFRDFPNTMLYTIQEIFFRLHQGPRLDDHARTLSSLLLAEIDKKNLNPLKQMRVIEQLRQYNLIFCNNFILCIDL